MRSLRISDCRWR